MAGRKPKPTAMKELEGNPGKRKRSVIISWLRNAIIRRLLMATNTMLIRFRLSSKDRKS